MSVGTTLEPSAWRALRSRRHLRRVPHAKSATRLPSHAVAPAEDELTAALDRPIFVVAPPQAGTHFVVDALARSPGVRALGLAGQRAINIEETTTEPEARQPSDRLTAADATPARSRRLRGELGRLVARTAGTARTPSA